MEEFRKSKGKTIKQTETWGKNYIGSTKPSYQFRASTTKQIAKEFTRKYKDISLRDYTDLLKSLSRGQSNNEVTFVGRLLQNFPGLRKDIDPKLLDYLLEKTEGWEEVDSICQSSFDDSEMLPKWNDWEKVLTDFSKDKNIHKRRASLVLLTRPVRHSGDPHLSKLAFNNIDILKSEKDILITKAVSWLLRDLIKNHRGEVERYLDKNEKSLPKIAIRETRNKLKSGRKSGK